MLALLLALAQAGAPTVGDTIWVTRTVRVPAGQEVRAADWNPNDDDTERDDVEPLGDARVTVTGATAEIGYPIVIWRPGAHTLQVPGPLLLGADGAVDSLPPQTVTVTVASVLPDVPADSTLPPQPRAAIVPRPVTDPTPLLVLWAAAAVLLAPVHFLWRRRGPRAPPAVDPTPMEPPVEHWADAGEYRVVAAVATGRVRGAMARAVPEAHTTLDTEDALAIVARARPDWPLGELGDLLRALDEARFAEPAFPDARSLYQWAGDMAERLGAGATP